MKSRNPPERLACVLFLLLAGCRELPPRLDDEYLQGHAVPGWPPLAVYDPDPFHPANRWFHRAFSARAPDGTLIRAATDEPLSQLAEVTAVDRAELGALLESMGRETGVGARRAAADPAAPVFAADALAEAARLVTLGEGADPGGELRRLLLAAAVLETPPGEIPALAVPPPLRAGKWKPVAPAALPGLEPSGWDFRWTGAWVEERPPDADAHGVITRSRIALDSAGEPVLLDLASECWEVTSGCVHAGRLFRFDRAEWLRGGDPWRPVPEAAVVGVRDPRDPSRVLTGSHGAIARGFPVLALGGEARAERTVQLEAARRVLRTVRAAPATPPPARAP